MKKGLIVCSERRYRIRIIWFLRIVTTRLVNSDRDTSDRQGRFSSFVDVVFHMLGIVKDIVFPVGRWDRRMESGITFPVVQKFWMIISEDRGFL